MHELAGEQRQQLGARHARVACQRGQDEARHGAPALDECIERRAAQGELVEEDERTQADDGVA